MSTRRYWTLRILLALGAVIPLYFGFVWAGGTWWRQLAVVLAVLVVFSLFEQPLKDRHGRTRRR